MHEHICTHIQMQNNNNNKNKKKKINKRIKIDSG